MIANLQDGPFDIFISYSHNDNLTYGEWVDKYVEKLTQFFKTQCGKELRFFFDQEQIMPGDVLPARIQNALKQSQIFMPILSVGYLNSKWCQDEFLFFSKEKNNDLIIDQRSRVIPIRLVDYERNEPDISEPGQRIVNILKEYDIVYANFVDGVLPFHPNDKIYQELMVSLSDQVNETLKEIQKKGNPHPKTKPIFLAPVSRDSKQLKNQIEKEIRRHFAIISIPEVEPVSSSYEEKLRESLNESMFSIHLFDDLEGRQIPSNVTEVHLAYALAKEKMEQDDNFRLYLVNNSTEYCSRYQKEFLAKVDQDTIRFKNIIWLPHTSDLELVHTIIDRAKALEAHTKPKNLYYAENIQRLFFIHTFQDQDESIRHNLQEIILQQKHDTYFPLFPENNSSTDPKEYYKECWEICDKALILLRNGSIEWCQSNKVQLIRLKKNTAPTATMAICVTEPELERRLREIRSNEFIIIDCTKEHYEEEVKKFLNL